jgi:hypothetical protein
VTSVEALPLGPSGIDLALALDLLLLDDRGAVVGPPLGDDGSGYFTGVDAVVRLTTVGFTDGSAPDCESGEAEAVVGLRAPPTVRCAHGDDGLSKISGTRDELWVEIVSDDLSTSHERSISSRSLALSLFECFAAFSRQRSNASISLSALVQSRAR